jgi:alginate O-acetyltransferase complex protein AlgI
MLFNSIEFAVFFPIVVALYFLVPRRLQTPLLLVSSCIFYMAFIPIYLTILFVTILIDYVAAKYIEDTQGPKKKAILTISVLATCLVLFIFKYFNFFAGNFTALAGLFGWKVSDFTLRIILPIGLSFHTFQSLSYVVEVYYGRQKTERDFLTYATYVMFFPQLVAGPIERPQNLLHQFHESHQFDYERITSGLRRMAWGFFKKLVIADRLSMYVSDVYAAPAQHTGLQLTIATFFFAYQIYCDFSGYSDIAVGSARILGFQLMENFNTPYWSRSIPEFWRRWHISLSTWFRDYVYVPLGGNRVKRVRWCLNVLVTFGLSGLWHGANWTYVAWGFLNGFYIVFGTLSKPLRDRILSPLGAADSSPTRNVLQLASTFGLTLVGWCLFRANSMSDAFYILTHFYRGWTWDLRDIATEHFTMRQFPVALAGILLLEFTQWIHSRAPLPPLLARIPQIPRWAFYLGVIYGVVFTGVFRETHFIYFQF